MLHFNLSPYSLPPSPTSSFFLQVRGKLCPTSILLTHRNKRARKSSSWHRAVCKGGRYEQKICCGPALLGRAPTALPAPQLPDGRCRSVPCATVGLPAAPSPRLQALLCAVRHQLLCFRHCWPQKDRSSNEKPCVQPLTASAARSSKRHDRVGALYL